MEIIYNLFPKFYKHLGLGELVNLLMEAGMDGVNIIIREGYWVTPGGFRKELPEFVKAVRKEGLFAKYANIDHSIEELVEDPTLLNVLADNGVEEFRLLHFRLKKGDADVRGGLSKARKQIEEIVPLCEKYNLRAIYQLHHYTLVPSASAAWNLVKGLPEKFIGVKIDPGNQYQEGYESWPYCTGLLGGYIRAVGVKDISFFRDVSQAETPSKGWRTRIAPLYEGITNWENLVAALNASGFRGTFVFMPFYSTDDHGKMTAIFKREAGYLKDIVSKIDPPSQV